MDPREIAELIEKKLTDCRAEVRTDGQGHYEATVVSEGFEGKRTLIRHRMVYDALGALVGREIHALQLRTMTPAESEAGAA